MNGIWVPGNRELLKQVFNQVHDVMGMETPTIFPKGTGGCCYRTIFMFVVFIFNSASYLLLPPALQLTKASNQLLYFSS